MLPPTYDIIQQGAPGTEPYGTLEKLAAWFQELLGPRASSWQNNVWDCFGVMKAGGPSWAEGGLGKRGDLMDSICASHCEVLRARFEGREAIFAEGRIVLRVRVFNIRSQGLSVVANVEEIITPGLGSSLLARTHSPVTSPDRWDIGGDPTSYSDHTWTMGYGGWRLYFDPEVIQAVIDFVARRINIADPAEGHSELCSMHSMF